MFQRESPRELRIVTAALCQELGRKISRVEDSGIEFAELRGLYESLYQPAAVRLVTALIHYVPIGDPRIIRATPADAKNRQITWSVDLNIVSEPLCQHLLATQLKGVVKSLAGLIEYLPED